MNTILVPTDYSTTASNAAHYAVHLAKQISCNRILLYNAYQVPVMTDALMMPVEMIGIEEMKEASEHGMENFKQQIKSYAGSDSGITIDGLCEYALLSENIDEICKDNNIDLVVIGITGGGKIEEVLVGSTTISIAKHTTIPVIIVPADVEFVPIEEIVLACDFKKIVETTPVAPLKKILDETHAKLLVLNIHHEKKHADDDAPFESLMLDTLLQGYNPEYHFIDSPDFIEGMNHFALEKKVDLIITIPKKHGIFEGLFKRSHTKMLAFHSHVPLMVIHD